MPDASPVARPENIQLGKIRVDKWLWQARFFKSRALASAVAGSGGLRLNGTHVGKPSQLVRPGDVLTFPQASRIRVIRIEALGDRRGPAPEARALYSDLDETESKPAGDSAPTTPATRVAGSGRPTKKERRRTDALRNIPD